MFLEPVGDKTEQGKRKVSIFFLYCSGSYFLIGIYVSDKTRNCCQMPAFLQGSYGIRHELAYR